LPCVQFTNGSERNRPLIWNVSERSAGETGNSRARRRLGENFIERSIVVANFVARRSKISADNRSALLKRARENEMSQHSIDSINRLADVLDNQNRTFEVGSKWSSEECSD